VSKLGRKRHRRNSPQIAREINAQLTGGGYRATAEELEALDDAEGSGVASEAEVEAAFRRFRDL